MSDYQLITILRKESVHDLNLLTQERSKLGIDSPKENL
jgi:hypothetical protein